MWTVPIGSRGFLAGVLAAGASLRLIGLDHPQLWLDEIIQIQRFNHSSLAQALADLRTETAPAPLDYLVQRVFLSIFGLNETGARLHAALAGVLSLLVFRRLAWQAALLIPPRADAIPGKSPSPVSTWRESFANAAVFLLAFYPLHVFLSREGRPYSLFFLFTLVSFWLLLRALRDPAKGAGAWVAYGLALAAALYTSYLGLILLALQAAWVALLWLREPGQADSEAREGGRGDAKKTAPSLGLVAAWAGQAAALLLFAPWLWWTFSQTRDVYHENFLSIAFAKRLVQESSGGSWPLSLVLIGLAAWGIARLWQRSAWAASALLVLWLGGGLAAVLALDAWRGYFFAARQILFAAPAGLLAAALAWSLSKRLRRSLGAVVLVASLGAGAVILSNSKGQADWVALAELLREVAQPGDGIAAPGLDRALAFRYPPLEERQIALEDLLEKGKAPTRVLLVESRYLNQEQERLVHRCLERFPPGKRLRTPGFTLYVLRPKPRSPGQAPPRREGR